MRQLLHLLALKNLQVLSMAKVITKIKASFQFLSIIDLMYQNRDLKQYDYEEFMLPKRGEKRIPIGGPKSDYANLSRDYRTAFTNYLKAADKVGKGLCLEE